MTLELNGIDVECIIGDLPEERDRPQHLSVDVAVEIVDDAADSDSLGDTVDYAALSAKISEALKNARCRMIERAAKLVHTVCMSEARVISSRVRVTKTGCVPGLGAAVAVYGGDAASCAPDIRHDAGELVSLLLASGTTCSVAESCTGGGIGSAITSVPGSSAVFAGGVVSYSNDVKSGILGVKEHTLSSAGAVSAETAAEMAEGVRALMKTDFAVSVTGIAGPGGGTEEKPVGLVWFGISDRDGVRTFSRKFDGDRDAVRSAAVSCALSSLAESVRKR